MLRAALFAVALPFLGGGDAADPATVDYRLGVETPKAGGAPLLTVEIRLRGDASGRTTLDLPDRFAGSAGAWRYLSDLKVEGASVSSPDAAHRLLTHRPGAKLTVRYRVQGAYARWPDAAEGVPAKGAILRTEGVAAVGRYVFAVPAGRDGQPAAFHWTRLPKGWTVASDLEHGAQGRPLTVADIPDSLVLAAPDLRIVEQALPGGPLRLALPGPGQPATGLADDLVAKDATALIAAQRDLWRDAAGPYLVGVLGLTEQNSTATMGGVGLGDAFVLYASPHAADRLAYTLAHENLHSWIPRRLAPTPAQPSGVYWQISEGFTDFMAARLLLRTGLETPADVVGRLGGMLFAYDHSPERTAPAPRIAAGFLKDDNVTQLAYQRGALLALKWDEDVRRKTGGKADLDDVLVRMREHAAQFPPGQAPDLVTALISAVWVTAGLDIRPDIAKYAEAGAPVELPDELFDGCLQARVTVSPAFDAGFDTAASFAAKKLTGVRRRGPAWNSGLRDGMLLQSWTYQPGDTTRQIELTVRAGKAKPKKIAYWPYGDADTQSRKLQLTPGMSAQQIAACGRKIAGL